MGQKTAIGILAFLQAIQIFHIFLISFWGFFYCPAIATNVTFTESNKHSNFYYSFITATCILQLHNGFDFGSNEFHCQ